MKFIRNILFVALAVTPICLATLADAADTASQKNPASRIKSIVGPADDVSQAALKTGIGQVEAFFGRAFPRPFLVRFHSHRIDMDKQWAQDWKTPGFKSECWMVASGVGDMLDLLSPTAWAKEACEHDARNVDAIQKLITHELTHVFHGQVNPSSDFADVEGLDWVVEGLAVYVSGQLNDERRAEVLAAVKDNKVPASLDSFRTGQLRYGQSGSVVAWIDTTYGRATTIQLLALKRKFELLEKLNLTEARLLQLWRAQLLGKP
ncbi:MAG: hypothetical protein ABL931_22455 [Usitatibacteraceae bacterium]